MLVTVLVDFEVFRFPFSLEPLKPVTKTIHGSLNWVCDVERITFGWGFILFNVLDYGVLTLGGVLPYQFRSNYPHLFDPLMVVESIGNVEEQSLSYPAILLLSLDIELVAWKAELHIPLPWRAASLQLLFGTDHATFRTCVHIHDSRPWEAQRDDEQLYPLPLWKMTCGRTIKPWLWFWSLFFLCYSHFFLHLGVDDYLICYCVCGPSIKQWLWLGSSQVFRV